MNDSTPAKGVIPHPYRPVDRRALKRNGRVFYKEDFYPEDCFRTFDEEAVISYDRTMAIIFCDLKGSTSALRALGPTDFREVQTNFFESCATAVKIANNDGSRKAARKKNGNSYPWASVDKFMGDCAMFWVDCGNPDTNTEQNNKLEEKRRTAVIAAIKIVKAIVEAIPAIEKEHSLDTSDVPLGARFGIALGSNIILSVLGKSTLNGGDFTVTGEVVNLAARLEHATSAEFLACIAEARSNATIYSSQVGDSSLLRGSWLGDVLLASDRQVIDLYDVCEKKFQIRADTSFVKCFETAHKDEKFAWRRIPFTPRGFEGRNDAHILGGSSLAELFRVV